MLTPAVWHTVTPRDPPRGSTAFAEEVRNEETVQGFSSARVGSGVACPDARHPKLSHDRLRGVDCARVYQRLDRLGHRVDLSKQVSGRLKSEHIDLFDRSEGEGVWRNRKRPLNRLGNRLSVANFMK